MWKVIEKENVETNTQQVKNRINRTSTFCSLLTAWANKYLRNEVSVTDTELFQQVSNWPSSLRPGSSSLQQSYASILKAEQEYILSQTTSACVADLFLTVLRAATLFFPEACWPWWDCISEVGEGGLGIWDFLKFKQEYKPKCKSVHT